MRQTQPGYDALLSSADPASMNLPTLHLKPIGGARGAHDCPRDGSLRRHSGGKRYISSSTKPKSNWTLSYLHDFVRATSSLRFEVCMRIEPNFKSRSCRKVELLLLKAPCAAYMARMRQEGQLQARTIVEPALTRDRRGFVRHGLVP
jgi:hypothetical protein